MHARLLTKITTMLTAVTLTADVLADNHLSASGSDLVCSEAELAMPAPYINCSVRGRAP